MKPLVFLIWGVDELGIKVAFANPLTPPVGLCLLVCVVSALMDILRMSRR